MKKRLFSLLAIATLTTTAWADISEEQLAIYMKLSGTDVAFENMQKQMPSTIRIQDKLRTGKVPEGFLKELIPILTKKENLEKFTKGFNSLDEEDYKQIIEFYHTKIGQKCAALARQINDSNIRQKIVEFSKKELPQKREILISKLIKLSMFVKKMEKTTKLMMKISLDSMPKEMQKRVKEKMNAQLTKIIPIIKKQSKLTTAYAYRDYSDEELQLLINYYQTTPAKMEQEAMIEGTLAYQKAVMPQIIKMVQNSKIRLACMSLKSLSASLMMFKLDNTMYPSTEEGLEALLKNPDAKKYPHYASSPYIMKMVLDPWGSKIIYNNNNGKIELISYGADKKEGGEKENRDILLSECKK